MTRCLFFFQNTWPDERRALIASYTYAHLPKASAHPLSSAVDVFVNVVSSVSEGGVGRSDASAGWESIPSPCPPTSVRYVLNVSDVNFSDSRAEMREVSLDEEKSVDDISVRATHGWRKGWPLARQERNMNKERTLNTHPLE